MGAYITLPMEFMLKLAYITIKQIISLGLAILTGFLAILTGF